MYLFFFFFLQLAEWLEWQLVVRIFTLYDEIIVPEEMFWKINDNKISLDDDAKKEFPFNVQAFMMLPVGQYPCFKAAALSVLWNIHVIVDWQSCAVGSFLNYVTVHTYYVAMIQLYPRYPTTNPYCTFSHGFLAGADPWFELGKGTHLYGPNHAPKVHLLQEGFFQENVEKKKPVNAVFTVLLVLQWWSK